MAWALRHWSAGSQTLFFISAFQRPLGQVTIHNTACREMQGPLWALVSSFGDGAAGLATGRRVPSGPAAPRPPSGEMASLAPQHPDVGQHPPFSPPVELGHCGRVLHSNCLVVSPWEGSEKPVDGVTLHYLGSQGTSSSATWFQAGRRNLYSHS